MRRRRRIPALETCPHCGAEFRAGRLACPECGSDAETGWRDAEEIDYRSVEIPDTYEELVSGSSRPRGISGRTRIVAAIVVSALAWLVLKGLF